MGGVVVVTDSGADLPATAGEADGPSAVEVVPLTIRFGEEEFVDRVELSNTEFWARCATSKELPTTAAPSIGAFAECFERAGDAGASGVLCVTLASSLSGTYQSAVAAAAAFGALPVRVVDSRSVTLGQGLLVAGLAARAAGGRSLDDLARDAETLRGRLRLYGTIETLDHLRRGGRVGALAALLGSVLAFKPVIEVRDGAVELESRQRTRQRAWAYLLDKVTAVAAPGVELAGIVHAGASGIEAFAAEASRRLGRPLPITSLGPVVGAHTGPGTVAVGLLLAG